MPASMIKKIFILVIFGTGLLGLVLASGSFVRSQTGGSPFVQTIQATSVSTTGATLSGQVNPNGFQVSYYFEYGTTQTLGTITSAQTLTGGYSSTNVTYAIGGLSANTTYYFRITAQNQWGTAQGSILSFTTPASGSGGGGLSVTTNAVTNITATGATLNAFAGTGSTQSTGWFEYGTDPSFLSQSTPTTIIGTSDFYRQAQTNSFFRYALTNLTPGTTYYFRAALQNSGTTNYGSTLSFQTYGSPYSYYQQTTYQEPVYQQPTYTYAYGDQSSYQTTPDVSTVTAPQYIYVPKYIYVNGNEPNSGAVSYSYNQQPAYSYPGNYSVSAFMPTQYPYGYAPYAQMTPQGTQYNAPLAASIGTITTPNQISVLVGFILLVSVIVVLGALAFGH